MLRSKKITIMLLLALSSLMTFADDTTVYENTSQQTTESIAGQDKLSNSLKETDLEIKIRQKIEKQIQEQNSVAQESSQVQTKTNYSDLHIALMYIPNRLIDLTDIITIGAGVGPEASLELTLTKLGQFGASYGDRYFIEKGFNRQYGGGYSGGYNAAFACWSYEEQVVDYCFGTVNPYVNLNLKNSSIPCPCSEPYKSGNVDFWRIGVQGGWLVDVEVAIHPTAIANFFTGFAFIRLTDTSDL